MTNPPADILLRIEQLLGAGRQQEATPLLVEFIKLNPASARAWWLLSLVVTDVNQQVDCLQRVIRLEPNNEPARERLVKLINQPPAVPVASSYAASGPVEPVKEKPAGDEPAEPAWAAAGAVSESAPIIPASEQMPPASPAPAEPTEPAWAAAGAESESATILPAEEQVPPVPPAPAGPVGKVTHPRKKKPMWGLAFIIIAGFAILTFAFYVGYLLLQRFMNTDFQTQENGLQETLAVAQTLTSLPLPTMIPTWTASPTVTFIPSSTPTQQYTLTRTPPPPDLVAPLEGFYVPDFSLTASATGQQVTLSQYSEKPVLLFFWATWCPNCVNAMDSIETITQTYKDTGLVVLTIDVAEDPATVSTFLTTHPLTFPILLDPDSSIQNLYFVDAIPAYFFINSSGMITFIGRSEMTLDEITAQVDAIMGNVPTSTP